MILFVQSSVLIASWYKEFQEGTREFVDERVELRELVRKLSKRQEASSSQAIQGSTSDSEVENLRLFLAAKDQEILESKHKHYELETANIHLQELLDAATQKNHELMDHAKEVDANVHQAAMQHFKVVEELHQVWTSEEGFWKLFETLETQLSRLEDACKKFEADLKASRERCGRFREGYLYWKAKAARYFMELSLIPWLRDLLWVKGFHWGFENCRYLTINRERFNIDPATVEFNFLTISASAIDELVDTSRDLIPNAPEVNVYGLRPVVNLPPSLLVLRQS